MKTVSGCRRQGPRVWRSLTQPEAGNHSKRRYRRWSIPPRIPPLGSDTRTQRRGSHSTAGLVRGTKAGAAALPPTSEGRWGMTRTQCVQGTNTRKALRARPPLAATEAKLPIPSRRRQFLLQNAQQPHHFKDRTLTLDVLFSTQLHNGPYKMFFSKNRNAVLNTVFRQFWTQRISVTPRL